MELTSTALGYFDNPVATVWLLPNYVYVDAKAGSFTVADFSQHLHQLTLAIASHGGGKVLYNHRLLTPFTFEQRQLLTSWLAEVVKTWGLRFGAIVVSPDITMRLTSRVVVSKAEREGLAVTHGYFDSLAEAQAWLLAQ